MEVEKGAKEFVTEYFAENAQVVCKMMTVANVVIVKTRPSLEDKIDSDKNVFTGDVKWIHIESATQQQTTPTIILVRLMDLFQIKCRH